MKRVLRATRTTVLPKIGLGVVMALSGAIAHAEIIVPSLEIANEITGARVLEPGNWGGVRSVVANRSDNAALPIVVAGFPADPLRQFESRVWLPPLSTREVRTPLLPDRQPEKALSVDLVTRVQATVGAPPGASASGTASLTRGRYETVVVAPVGEAEVPTLVGALRKAAGIKPTMFLLQPRNLPTTADGYEAIDSVFLSGHEIDLDPLRREALVGFVERGGRLWIMLESVDQVWPRELLGDRWDIAALDTVELTEFELEGPSGVTKQAIDHGVSFTRVVAPSFEAMHTIQGVPASLHKAVGRGELVVTTLGVRGWLETDDSVNSATRALGDFQSFVAPPEEPKLLGSADIRIFDPHIGREIGHEVLGRGLVAAVFGFATLGAIGAAFWTSRAKKLELAAPASALLALVSGAVLVGLGKSSQSKTPSVAATDQLVLYSDIPDRAEVFARTSVYISPDDDAASSTLRTTRGGVVVPDRRGAGTLERFVWTDPDHLELVGLDLRPGAAASLTSHFTVSEVDSARAIIGFDADGIRGKLDLGGSAWRGQPLLVTASGTETLEIASDGTLRRPANGVHGSGVLRGEEETARQQMARDVLRSIWYPTKPTVLVWSELVGTGIELPVSEKGNSLRAIPVVFDVPAHGTRIAVPSVFLTPEPLRGEAGGRKSGVVYDSSKRTWLEEMHQPMLVMMKYGLPAGFGGFDVESAELTIDLRAPGRRFDVVVLRDGKIQIAGGGVNPSGRQVFNLAGKLAPQMDADGRILVGIDVHASASMGDGPSWSLQRMDLSVEGSTR